MAVARHFRELDCWQLAYTLKVGLYRVARHAARRGDFKFVEQVRDAAASAPRNIAEGFGCKTHKDFARFLDFARASLAECQNHIIDAVDRGYVANPEERDLLVLSQRAIGATAALARYLRSTPDPE